MDLKTEIQSIKNQLEVGELMLIEDNDEEVELDTIEDMIFDNIFDMDSYDLVESIGMDVNQKVGYIILRLNITNRQVFKLTKLLYRIHHETEIDYVDGNVINIDTRKISDMNMLILTKFILLNFKTNIIN